MTKFAKNAAFLFLALRTGDLVSLAAGMWFAPKYISPAEIGALLPLTSFATFLSLPVFAFAMTVMKESSRLAAAMLVVAVGAAASVSAPRFFSEMGVGDRAAGSFAVAAAFLGCVAPVFTDALQSLKRFGALGVVETGSAIVRFAVMAVAMPLRALGGFFAAQAALPAFRIVFSLFSLRKDLAVPAEPFWDGAALKRIGGTFLAVLAYQASPMAAILVEQALLRTALPGADSAGYYMVTRFSDLIHYISFPLLIVLFPYTATAAKRGEPIAPYVVKCSAAVLAVALAMAGAALVCAPRLVALMPHGSGYVAYSGYMAPLAIFTALTACQVFYANAEVSAGRFGFLFWLVPLHTVYPALLYVAVRLGWTASLGGFVAWMGAAAFARFAFSVCGVLGRRQVQAPGAIPSA